MATILHKAPTAAPFERAPSAASAIRKNWQIQDRIRYRRYSARREHVFALRRRVKQKPNI